LVKVKLGNIVTFLDNLRKPVNESLRIEGPYPYYGANGQQGTINNYIFDEPLVLLAEDGGHFGSKTKPISYKILGKTWVNNHAHVLRPKSNINIDYLNRHLQFYDVTKYISGTTRKKLTKAQASNIELRYPPLPEQKRIADTLDKADELRQKRKKAIELLDEYVKSVFYDMFGDPVKNEKGWEVKKIADLVQETTNINPINQPYKIFEYIDISSIDNMSKKIIYVKTFKGLDAPSRARQIINKNDVLVSTVRPNLNAVAIVLNNYNNPLASTGFCILRPNIDFISTYYLFEICKMDFFISNLTKIAKGASYPAVTDNDIKNTNITLPPIELQNKFASIVEQVEKTKLKMQESLKEMDNLFNSLMQRAFKGEI
jgi:type I restriction enzyme S subunit